jgi:hypothetical protein
MGLASFSRSTPGKLVDRLVIARCRARLRAAAERCLVRDKRDLPKRDESLDDVIGV